MKRFATALVATATALSLSTGAAVAESSDAADKLIAASENGTSDPHLLSASTMLGYDIENKTGGASTNLFIQMHGSSYDNDLKQGYPVGTTADILWGVGIAVAILGTMAVNSGLIPGLPLK